VLVLILVVFVAGEMLWAPTADAVAARLAPSESRGAVMGTMGIAMWVGGALAPAVGLHVADTAGDGAMWLVIAAAGLAAGSLYWTGARLLGARDRSGVPAEVAEAA
jgi:dipeptide/tripeptide permease